MRTNPENPYSTDCFEAEVLSEGSSQLSLVPPLDLLKEGFICAKAFAESRAVAKGLRCFQEDVSSMTRFHHPNFFLYELPFTVSVNAYHDFVQGVRVWLRSVDR